MALLELLRVKLPVAVQRSRFLWYQNSRANQAHACTNLVGLRTSAQFIHCSFQVPALYGRELRCNLHINRQRMGAICCRHAADVFAKIRYRFAGFLQREVFYEQWLDGKARKKSSISNNTDSHTAYQGCVLKQRPDWHLRKTHEMLINDPLKSGKKLMLF